MDVRDRFRGCLLGGAAGDALGYPVEFLPWSQIQKRYGEAGIPSYDLARGEAQISDDTQMTLFTACGLLLGMATRLAHSGRSVKQAFPVLGEGWVAEETLAIALFCALRWEDDFDTALRASVNHSGDSDSTGAVCGAILGARLGLSGIPEKYRTHLELADTALELADDLERGGGANEAEQQAKYVDLTWGQ